MPALNATDILMPFFALGMFIFVRYQFRIGAASGRGGWVKKAEHPRQFAFLIGGWIMLTVIPAVISGADIILRLVWAIRSR